LSSDIPAELAAMISGQSRSSDHFASFEVRSLGELERILGSVIGANRFDARSNKDGFHSQIDYLRLGSVEIVFGSSDVVSSSFRKAMSSGCNSGSQAVSRKK
jgi:hypothetical protein